MRHLLVAFAAMMLLACGALQAFDSGPAPVLVTAPVHHADFPLCVTVKPPPLLKHTKPVLHRQAETV
jgi:hypothetical protein